MVGDGGVKHLGKASVRSEDQRNLCTVMGLACQWFVEALQSATAQRDNVELFWW